jgi:hypothetical protein
MDKLKNKKKDVITLEGSLIKSTSEIAMTAQNPSSVVEDNLNNNKNKNEESKPIPVDSNDNSTREHKISSKINDTESNNSTIKKILFKIQLLLSMTNKLDSKLLTILTRLLSEEHLKGILEERDSRGICGNLSCGSKLVTKLENSEKYYYNFNSKDFSKDTVSDFFCDVKCYQKFKYILIITKNFDYLRLLNVETIFLLSIIKEFFANNSYLEEISVLSNQILSKQYLIQTSQENSHYFVSLKEKYTKYFLGN